MWFVERYFTDAKLKAFRNSYLNGKAVKITDFAVNLDCFWVKFEGDKNTFDVWLDYCKIEKDKFGRLNIKYSENILVV